MNIVKEVEAFTRRVSKLKVAVVGETITDEFIYVSYEGQSMKSICPVFRIEGGMQRHMGGAAAIAGHLKDFVKSVTLISNPADEIVKTRYLELNNNKKHVEINSFHKLKPFNGKIKSGDYDVVIVADFGHGYLNGKGIEGKFHLMCQTNSNNFGFNRVSKWKDFKKHSVCLDLREASLQINRKIASGDTKGILELFNYELNSDYLFVTTGSSGSVFTDGKKVYRQESYKSEIVDTIGAGDTFFAFASLAAQFPPAEKKNLMAVPALAASLSTTWLANDKSVNRKSLMEYAKRHL